MFDLVALRDDLGGTRLALYRARNRFLHGAIIVVLNFLVVGRIPVNEDADADEEVVGLVLRDDALGHAVGDGLGDGMLGRPEHLHGLLGAFRYLLLACLVLCWLRSVTLLVLAGRPILGIVCDHRWHAGAPLDPRARWLHLPPIEATEDEWIWVRAHMLVGATRIRMERVQSSLTWALLTTGVFLLWLVTAFLAQ